MADLFQQEYDAKQEQKRLRAALPVETTMQEISPQKAALLRRRGLPDNVAIVEREEVVYWDKVYSRSDGGCLYVPEHLDPIERYMPAPKKPAPLLGCDLFCGAGGFSLGVELAGIDVVCAAEWDIHAAWTYLTNLGRTDTNLVFGSEAIERKFHAARARAIRRGEDPDPEDWMGSAWRRAAGDQELGCRGFYMGDVAQVSGDELLAIAGVDRFDVVFGGPPCQGMSTASSKASVDDPRNALLFEFMRIVVETHPKYFIIENVPPLLTIGGGVLYKRILEIANDAGYDVVADVLNAVNYGVPQHRRRAIIVGSEQGRPMYQFPMPTHWLKGKTAAGEIWDMTDREDEEEEQTETKGKRKGQQSGPSLFDSETGS